MRQRALHATAGDSQRGFALLEVMVALLLVGALLGALAPAAQRALDAAVRLRGTAGALSPVAGSDPYLCAWDWGAGVARAEWAAGTVLKLRSKDGSGDHAMVGVWCDGWLLGEWEMPATEALVLRQDVWEGHTGEEVILRTRLEDGGWGPPWRTVVPDSYGLDTTELALGGQEMAQALSYEAARTAVHLLCRSTCTPQASWSSQPFARDLLGALHILSEYGSGLCRATVGGRTQSWLGTQGRRLDVYF